MGWKAAEPDWAGGRAWTHNGKTGGISFRCGWRRRLEFVWRVTTNAGGDVAEAAVQSVGRELGRKFA